MHALPPALNKGDEGKTLKEVHSLWDPDHPTGCQDRARAILILENSMGMIEQRSVRFAGKASLEELDEFDLSEMPTGRIHEVLVDDQTRRPKVDGIVRINTSKGI